jgi:hypothetical protein
VIRVRDMAEVCNVCAENCNKSTRISIACNKCEFSACKVCQKTYLLSKKENVHCMSCKVEWDRKFMSKSFGVSFMSKDYKNHRETMLFEKEISMLQATQPYVENQIKLEKLEKRYTEWRAKVREKEVLFQIEFNKLRNGKSEERKKFIRKCPNGDCKGFLSSSLKCEICEIWACGECREIKGYTTEDKEAHVCDKEIVESVKLISKDSKACPKCAVLTFKIEGCNQMFCVECHTPWCWRTGKIETGTIHNPHYFEWQKKQTGNVPRNPLDIECGRELDNNFVMILSRKILGKTADEKKEDIILDICRNVIHIRHVELRRFQTNALEDNLNLRIDYMRNKINKDGLKSILQKNDKANQKKKEISNIILMYITCMTDLFYRSIQEKILLQEMNELRDYTNDCLYNVGKSYNSKQYSINEKFEFI